MGSYYDKSRAQKGEYGNHYDYYKHSCCKKRKDKYDNDSYDHSSDKKKKYDYPTINVKQIVNCCDHKKDDKNTTKSAFRAVKSITQLLSPVPRKVLYPAEVLDVNNEYDPTTSTFIAQQSGIYSFNASIFFIPDNPDTRYLIFIDIQVNGTSVASDSETVPFGSTTIDVSVIQQLQAGDRVEVFAGSGAGGQIQVSLSETRFEGARIG